MDELTDCLTALTSEKAADREAAAERLCHLGEQARDAAVALVRACADDEPVSTWAVAALEELGPPPIGTRDQLAELSKAPEEAVAYWATTLLGRLGQDTGPCVPSLVACLETSPHASVRQRAAWALGRVGPQASMAKDGLKTALESADARLARFAEEALRSIQTE